MRRKPDRARYDRDTIDAILDEALHCHVGVVRDDGPVVVPTVHARVGDVVYLHGSPAAGFLRDGRRGMQICLTATLIDGLVLAKSARNHSLNYRSVVLFGTARQVTDREEKLVALEAITNKADPGRWDVVRRPNDDELREVEVLAVTIDEASAKVRTGPPAESALDAGVDAWAGVVPLSVVRGEPIGLS